MWYLSKPHEDQVNALREELRPWLEELETDYGLSLDEEFIACKLLRWRAVSMNSDGREVRFHMGLMNGFSIRVIDRRTEIRDFLVLVVLFVGVIMAIAYSALSESKEPTVFGLILSIFASPWVLVKTMFRYHKDKDVWVKR